MNIGIPSRFACLEIEEDPASSSKSNTTNKSTKNKNKKVKKPTTPAANNQNKSNSNTNKGKKAKQKDQQQWEEWKRKDDELVNDHYEHDLQSAILQSKLDFEQQQKNRNDVIVLSTNAAADSGSKKKKTTMSLSKFLETEKGDKSNEEKKENNGKKTGKSKKLNGEINGDDFFDTVEKIAKNEVKRDDVQQNLKKRNENIDEVISLAQCQEKLQKEREKNAKLEQELKEAKQEIALVKKRNSTLCSMLSQGEMKDKAAVLLELERLSNVKEELTEEIGKLHKLLEKERSSKPTADSQTNKKLSEVSVNGKKEKTGQKKGAHKK